MAKPKGKGKGQRKAKGGGGGGPRRELWLKEESQEYAQVEKCEGGPHMRLRCADGHARLGVVRGKMRRRQWMRVGDTVLVSLRDFQDDKCDILHTYTAEEVRKLRSLGALPEALQGGAALEEPESGGFVFDDAAPAGAAAASSDEDDELALDLDDL